MLQSQFFSDSALPTLAPELGLAVSLVGERVGPYLAFVILGASLPFSSSSATVVLETCSPSRSWATATTEIKPGYLKPGFSLFCGKCPGRTFHGEQFRQGFSRGRPWLAVTADRRLD